MRCEKWRKITQNHPDLVTSSVIRCDVHLSRAAISHVGVTVMNYHGNCGLLNVRVVWVWSTLTRFSLKCQPMNSVCSGLSFSGCRFFTWWGQVSIQINAIPTGLCFLLTSKLLAALVTLLLVLWLCGVKQLGGAFCDGYGSFFPIHSAVKVLAAWLWCRGPETTRQLSARGSSSISPSSAELPTGQ